MAITIKYFDLGWKAEWLWPLHVELLPPSREISEQLRKQYWTSKLTVFLEKDDKPIFHFHPNILLFHQGMEEAYSSILHHKVPVYAAVILIIDPDIVTKQQDPGFEQQLNEMVKNSNTHGIFIFSIPNSLDIWFHNFVIELSHNNHVPEALNRTVLNGCFYYDARLEEETKISSFIPVIISTLRSKRHFLGSIPTPWHSGNDISRKILAEYLEQRSPYFMYDHESDEAEKIAQLNRFFDAQPEIQFVVNPELGGDDDYTEFIHTGGEVKKEETGEAMMEEAEAKEDNGIEELKEETSSDIPRYLQAGIYNAVKELQEKTLNTETLYYINIGIGYPKKERVRGAQSFPAKEIFKETKTEKETIRIVFATNISEVVQAGDISLPKNGNSKEITFYFTTPPKTTEFKAEITAFHKNRPVQKALLTGYISNKPESAGNLPGIAIDITETHRLNLQDLGNRSGFSTSLELSENVQGNLSIRGISRNNPVELNFTEAVKNLMKEIKLKIEDTVINIDQYPENLLDQKNVDLLIWLALRGNTLYADHFKKQTLADGPIKITTNRAEFVPLDFMYTFPPPLKDAKLCEHALEALEDGKCKGCSGILEDPSPILCPLGFWCFSKVVERSSLGNPGANGRADYTVKVEPGTGNDTLDILHNTLFASSEKVYAASPGLKEKVLDALKKNSEAIFEAPDWEAWMQFLANNKETDCLILLVHIEKDKDLGIETVEIGDGKFRLINYFNEKMVVPTGAAKPPFIILIGCESANIANFEFDLSNKFLDSGAGIIVSSFTKIRGRQAGPMVMKLVEFLKSKSGQPVSLGEVLLKLRQYLLMKGLLVGLSLVTFGDADWKIKS